MFSQIYTNLLLSVDLFRILVTYVYEQIIGGLPPFDSNVIPEWENRQEKIVPKISKRLLEAAKPRDKDYIICDEKLPGFGARVMPSGRISFIISYRINKRPRRMSLGQFGVITPEQARKMAMKYLSSVKEGHDPSAERKAKRNAKTVNELAERFDKEHISIRLKAATATEYRRNLRRFILPAIGHLKVADVTRADISDLHGRLSYIPYQANRNLEVISKMFNMAELWGLRPDGSNPRRHIQKFPEKKRKRYLSNAEYTALFSAIKEAEHYGLEDKYALYAIKLILHTGCRLNEIMALKWAFIDIEEGIINLPTSKTGARTVYLSNEAIIILNEIEEQLNNPWVICGQMPGSHRTDIQRLWRRLRCKATVHYWKSVDIEAAKYICEVKESTDILPGYTECREVLSTQNIILPIGLTDVRIHDLRHSFASSAVSQGMSLPIIGKLLGHTQVQTTARYAHLSDDPLKEAVKDIGRSIAGNAGLKEDITA